MTASRVCPRDGNPLLSAGGAGTDPELFISAEYCPVCATAFTFVDGPKARSVTLEWRLEGAELMPIDPARLAEVGEAELRVPRSILQRWLIGFLRDREARTFHSRCQMDGGSVPVIAEKEIKGIPVKATWCLYCALIFVEAFDKLYSWELVGQFTRPPAGRKFEHVPGLLPGRAGTSLSLDDMDTLLRDARFPSK